MHRLQQPAYPIRCVLLSVVSVQTRCHPHAPYWICRTRCHPQGGMVYARLILQRVRPRPCLCPCPCNCRLCYRLPEGVSTHARIIWGTTSGRGATCSLKNDARVSALMVANIRVSREGFNMSHSGSETCFSPKICSLRAKHTSKRDFWRDFENPKPRDVIMCENVNM